jgi:hypothetical protein
MSLTDLLAAWGAIFSTGSIIWNVARDLGDCGRLRITAELGRPMLREDGATGAWKTPASPDSPLKDLLIKIANTGRRPVKVEAVWFDEPGGGRHMLMPRQLPCLLAEGEDVVEYTDDLAFFREAISGLRARDSSGRIWRLPSRGLRELLAQAAKVGLR